MHAVERSGVHNSIPININMPSKGCMLSKGQGLPYSKRASKGAKEPPRRRKEKREIRIQTLFQRFNGGNISIDEYLESFKHHTGL